MAPMSPVRNQPSGVKAAAVAPASCQYAGEHLRAAQLDLAIRAGRRLLACGCLLAADQIRHSTPGSGRPTVSGRAAPSGFETSSPVSVVP